MLRKAALLLLACVSCQDEAALDAAWLASGTWNDGKAVVSVFRGRWMRYGQWREAEVRDYLIREFLDPRELTKRDREDPALLPVLKANRQVTFTTGTYDYRLMHSLFFDRGTGRLVKGVGTSQEGCGIVFQRWSEGRLRWDSYWEGEGAGTRPLPKDALVFFADEVAFLGALLPDGARITVLPSLLRNRLGDGEAVARTVKREGRRTLLLDGAGEVKAEYAYDADGFLESWSVPGSQELTRVSRRRLYYWQFTKPGDEQELFAK